jgi:hypothetical protein
LSKKLLLIPLIVIPLALGGYLVYVAVRRPPSK